MNVSNKEYRYRIKIIAENHLKKDEQRYIDSYVTKSNTHSYKLLYFNYGLLHSILVSYRLGKLSRAIKNLGTPCEKATNALRNLTTNLSAITTPKN